MYPVYLFINNGDIWESYLFFSKEYKIQERKDTKQQEKVTAKKMRNKSTLNYLSSVEY